MSLITFVVPVGAVHVYEKCFLSSPLFKGKSEFQILPQQGFQSSGLAFNDAIEIATSDVLVFAHQDVVFPARWAKQFLARVAQLECSGARVGVIGCVGITSKSQPAGHYYRHDREFFPNVPLPAHVETLDEMLVCFRKSSGLRFDPLLPSFFYYSVDICLQARARGLENFAVDAPCFHRAKNRKDLPKDFFVAQRYMMEKWRQELPVRTLSGTLGGKDAWRERIKQSLFSAIGYTPSPWWAEWPRIDPERILHADEQPGTEQN